MNSEVSSCEVKTEFSGFRADLRLRAGQEEGERGLEMRRDKRVVK